MTISISKKNLSKLIAVLLGAGDGGISLTRLEGSKNNQVFRAETSDRTYLAKVYFRHPNDKRDRLGAEWAFSKFAWNNGIRKLPEPIAAGSEPLDYPVRIVSRDLPKWFCHLFLQGGIRCS